jgi:hypothetical protein
MDISIAVGSTLSLLTRVPFSCSSHVSITCIFFFLIIRYKCSNQLSESIQQGVFHPLRELDETESLEGDQEVELPTEIAEINFGA